MRLVHIARYLVPEELRHRSPVKGCAFPKKRNTEIRNTVDLDNTLPAYKRYAHSLNHYISSKSNVFNKTQFLLTLGFNPKLSSTPTYLPSPPNFFPYARLLSLRTANSSKNLYIFVRVVRPTLVSIDSCSIVAFPQLQLNNIFNHHAKFFLGNLPKADRRRMLNLQSHTLHLKCTSCIKIHVFALQHYIQMYVLYVCSYIWFYVAKHRT